MPQIQRWISGAKFSAVCSEAGVFLPPVFGDMTVGIFFKLSVQVVSDLADDIVFEQVFAPFFGDGVFAVQHTENVSGNASSGIAVTCDIDCFQNSRFEIPLVMQSAVYADSQCFFRHPAFAEFCNVYGGSGFADSCKL